MSKRPGLLLAAVLATGAIAAAGTSHTHASWSDYKVVAHGELGAAAWSTPPPECGPIGNYKGGVIVGTFGDDVIDLRAANHPQIIMGLGGNDTIYGGNSGDCLVGGDGNDKLYGGNAKDILIGGAGDDYLDGGNAKDVLDGGGDASDVCDGGHGKDTVTNCGSGS